MRTRAGGTGRAREHVGERLGRSRLGRATCPSRGRAPRCRAASPARRRARPRPGRRSLPSPSQAGSARSTPSPRLGVARPDRDRRGARRRSPRGSARGSARAPATPARRPPTSRAARARAARTPPRRPDSGAPAARGRSRGTRPRRRIGTRWSAASVPTTIRAAGTACPRVAPVTLDDGLARERLQLLTHPGHAGPQVLEPVRVAAQADGRPRRCRTEGTRGPRRRAGRPRAPHALARARARRRPRRRAVGPGLCGSARTRRGPSTERSARTSASE